MSKIINKNLLLSIGDATQLLDVSASTLRRMDDKGIIASVRNVKNGKRYFFKADLLSLKYKSYKLVREWTKPGHRKIEKKIKDFYYPVEASLTGKIIMERASLEGLISDEGISVIINSAMELAGNVFYHNQGQWPDIEGAFYVLDRIERKMIIADRGVGLLKNLRLVKKNLASHAEALKLAFTEQISSRGLEGHRGYGLKFIRRAVEMGYLRCLVYQTGNARLEILANDKNLYIDEVDSSVQGCLAIVEF
ncbi:MAG: hypothetical protein A3B91_03850 [Candidatus Yanofskybacteria bacterium RIFCSPHIGHO2_02_FULL_41_29]|uniref:HTH merR-type domain-containing protein n=1 Tax=Candidatus Yanofskybacteria bacterium RIFCSPHIGHO2_01_FULL_41_53 TaxID=1802663 RepID=A0A1F8EH84_9BACT|nr:MAG: hypothetical protein A2650_05055 [Candidatus Yanofskybacteria bacterium RIFCSPHIGHO2_01_FULL_41_53]OGN10886.1 MAG: hypothetical protein A3B91_03850 [Candidatus Yanofskybacteria bacterium RIFCSPHIGHO2_02_FULL_41_29]OGN21763.1 MAG: hypothetical protein A2916_03360 [Candidatus Yanofskybacteria bacterium RIFCSPLOWO2_01_FULL_41_67]OGN29555.1 MAG: hypothetical protein A3H54_01490 [Candidatus Yanofskybacteria bacterium RIFCSPLOWO2_02_FULL_41_13]